MRKYIGLTMYLIGLVGISYAFFYMSGDNKDISSYQKNEENKKKQDIKIGNKQTEDKNINNIVESTTNNVENIINSGKKILNNKENIENNQIRDINIQDIEKNEEKENDILTLDLNEDGDFGKNEDIVLENIYLGFANLNLVKDHKYEEIYSILGESKPPLYKVEDKDIYIKILKSIEYEDKKNNMEELIQKIGGNIVETNLFGDKQLFVNIDVYYKKQSIMLVSYKGKTYLLVLPYEKYQGYKSYLNEVLFVN